MLAPNTEDIANTDDLLSSLLWFQLLLLARARCLNLGSGHRIGYLPLRLSIGFETFSVSVQSTGNDPNSVLGVPHFAPARTFFTRSSLCEGHSISINSYAPSRPSLTIDSVE